MTATELRALLAPYGIDPIKARGQHFLLDGTVTAAMLAAAEVRPGDTVVEVGPGPGILTGALLDAGARVAAIDIDRRFVPLLEAQFNDRSLRVTVGDAMQTAFADLVSGFGSIPEYKVVANLPYNITSAFVLKCILETPAPVSTTLLIQKEVAERIGAGPGKMNRLAAMVQAFARVRVVRKVPPGAFLPPPGVDSAIITIVRKDEPEIEGFFHGFDRAAYEKLLEAAFSSPRKQLRNNLQGLFSAYPGGIDAALSAAGVPERARPEELPVDMLKTLAFLMKNRRGRG